MFNEVLKLQVEMIEKLHQKESRNDFHRCFLFVRTLNVEWQFHMHILAFRTFTVLGGRAGGQQLVFPPDREGSRGKGILYA